jgi:hypothetical protein
MAGVKPALEAAGGKYLARAGEHRVYEGDWDENRYHGVGSLVNEGTGERKVGEWRNGVLYNGSVSNPTSKVSKNCYDK